MAAFEYGHYDGPYVVNQNAIRYNGFPRWNWGDAENKLSLTFMAYHGHAHSPDQVPQREAGWQRTCDRFGLVGYALAAAAGLGLVRSVLFFTWL